MSTVETERPDLAEKKAQLVVQNAENMRQAAGAAGRDPLPARQLRGQHPRRHRAHRHARRLQGHVGGDHRRRERGGDRREGDRRALVQVHPRRRARRASSSSASPTSRSVDPMYQYSLTWFKQLFVDGIRRSPQSEDLSERIANLNDFITYLLYTNICRSIFEVHKLMFSFLLTIKIQMGAGKIDLSEWRFLLSGGKLAAGNLQKPELDWLTPVVVDRVRQPRAARRLQGHRGRRARSSSTRGGRCTTRSRPRRTRCRAVGGEAQSAPEALRAARDAARQCRAGHPALRGVAARPPFHRAAAARPARGLRGLEPVPAAHLHPDRGHRPRRRHHHLRRERGHGRAARLHLARPGPGAQGGEAHQGRQGQRAVGAAHELPPLRQLDGRAREGGRGHRPGQDRPGLPALAHLDALAPSSPCPCCRTASR